MILADLISFPVLLWFKGTYGLVPGRNDTNTILETKISGISRN